MAKCLNRLNEELLERIQNSGRSLVSNAVIKGMYALRACIVSLNTTPADIDRLADLIGQLGRDVDETLRTGAPTHV